MTGLSAIRIRTELLDVELLGTESDGFALQQRLPAVCADVLVPALESAFARADPGDSYLYVDRLAIDVTDIPLDRLETELADAVGRELAEWFRRNAPASPRAPEATLSGSGNVHFRSTAETIDDAFVEFLRTGRLPWSFRVPTGIRLEQLVLDAWATPDTTRAPPPATRGRLRAVLAAPRVRVRLMMQFPTDFVATVIRAVAPQLTTAVDEVSRAAEALSVVAPFGAIFARQVWDVMLQAASRGTEWSAAELGRTAWRELPPAVQTDPALAAAVEQHWPGTAVPTDQSAGTQAVTARHPQTTATPKAAAVVAPHPATATVPPASDIKSPIVVDHAGTVLLHPFLPYLFEAVGIATGDELRDPNRAVSLLHYLATGATTTPEHEVTLGKVLCGVPLDEPVEADIGLTGAETEEADALLDAAIGHWDALGGSSADALRVEFLMRPGTLAVDGDGDWLLRVETRTVDILLDQLPWGIGLIKLPWMSRLLRVEWR